MGVTMYPCLTKSMQAVTLAGSIIHACPGQGGAPFGVTPPQPARTSTGRGPLGDPSLYSPSVPTAEALPTQSGDRWQGHDAASRQGFTACRVLPGGWLTTPYCGSYLSFGGKGLCPCRPKARGPCPLRRMGACLSPQPGGHMVSQGGGTGSWYLPSTHVSLGN